MLREFEEGAMEGRAERGRGVCLRERRRAVDWDAQGRAPAGLCIRCGRERYGEEGAVCSDCLRELERYDEGTVSAVMEVMDGELKKYLSDRLRDRVWNAVARAFPMGE